MSLATLAVGHRRNGSSDSRKLFYDASSSQQTLFPMPLQQQQQHQLLPAAGSMMIGPGQPVAVNSLNVSGSAASMGMACPANCLVVGQKPAYATAAAPAQAAAPAASKVEKKEEKKEESESEEEDMGFGLFD